MIFFAFSHYSLDPNRKKLLLYKKAGAQMTEKSKLTYFNFKDEYILAAEVYTQIRDISHLYQTSQVLGYHKRKSPGKMFQKWL